MSAQLQRFIVATDDPARSALYASYSSTLKLNLTGDVRNDRTIGFTIEPVISAAPGSGTLFVADFENTDTFQVAVGLPDQAPTAGTFKLTVATSTTGLTALAFDITAANLQTPISTAMVAGGYSACTVTSLGNGTFRIRANSVGAIPAGKIVSDATNLVPLCGVIVSEVSLGSASTYYIYVLSIRQEPLALAAPATLLAGTSVSNAVTQAMSATLDAINTVSFTIDPVGGTFNVSAYALGITRTCGPISGTATAAEFLALLENHPQLVNNVSVTKNGSSFIVQFIAAAGPKRITGSTLANPSVITTNEPHGYITGQTVTHSGTNSTPVTDGAQVVTVTGANTYTVPVNVTVAGTTGTSRDSTAPLLSVADIDLIAPKGVSGTINFNTENLVEYMAAQTAYSVDLQFSITRTRASGEYRNIYGPVTIQVAKDIVDPTSMVPSPLPSYYTSAQSDARYGQLATTNTWALAQTFSSDVTIAGTTTGATMLFTGTGVVGGTLQCASSITSSSPTDGIGYTSGGTVTQSTNKSTTVILNKVSGAITMNGAALNDATNVSFTVTNSAIAATDGVQVLHASAGTAGAYQVSANLIAAGSFKITVRNVSGGNLSEAIVLKFNVIKGSNT